MNNIKVNRLTLSKTNFGTQLTLLLHLFFKLHVQKCFLLGGGGVGTIHFLSFQGWLLHVFEVGIIYSKVRAFNQINIMVGLTRTY